MGPAGALLAVVCVSDSIKLAGSWDPFWCPQGKERGFSGLGVLVCWEEGRGLKSSKELVAGQTRAVPGL